MSAGAGPRSLSELTGKDLRWRFDLGWMIPRTFDKPCALFDGDEPVVTGRVMWQRLKTFDLYMDSGEGSFEAHMDLTDPGKRPAVVWKAGESQSQAEFRLWSEGSITSRGWITTKSGRQLVFDATEVLGAEYAIFEEGGSRLITVSAAFEHAIDGNPGHMLISAEEAADPELPALVVLGFALACEQTLKLHWDAPGPPGACASYSL